VLLLVCRELLCARVLSIELLFNVPLTQTQHSHYYYYYYCYCYNHANDLKHIKHTLQVRNETEAAARTVGGAALLRQYKRSELLALRRSALGQRLFGASQRAILATALRAWREVHSRRAAAVRAFALRYALAKCELDAQLEDAPPAAATANQSSAVQQLLAAPETVGFGTGGKGSLGQLPGRKTVLQHWKV
jgi:hypothetical protein